MTEKMLILGLDFRGVKIRHKLRYAYDVLIKGYTFVEVPMSAVNVIGREYLNDDDIDVSGMH